MCWGCAQGGRLGVGALTNLALGKEDFQNIYSKVPFIFQHIQDGTSVLGVCARWQTWCRYSYEL